MLLTSSGEKVVDIESEDFKSKPHHETHEFKFNPGEQIVSAKVGASKYHPVTIQFKVFSAL